MSVLVGRNAPDFIAPAVLANGEIVDELTFSKISKAKYSVLFFYPADFTFVCPSELLSLDHRISKFKERDVEIIGISVDSHFGGGGGGGAEIISGGIGEVSFALVADMNHKICRSYGVETPDGNVAYRASFLIDRKGIVRHQVVNDLPLGRDIDEMLRMVDALLFHEKYGEVCPAGWNAGDSGMKATPDGVAKYLEEHGNEL